MNKIKGKLSQKKTDEDLNVLKKRFAKINPSKNQSQAESSPQDNNNNNNNNNSNSVANSQKINSATLPNNPAGVANAANSTAASNAHNVFTQHNYSPNNIPNVANAGNFASNAPNSNLQQLPNQNLNQTTTQSSNQSIVQGNQVNSNSVVNSQNPNQENNNQNVLPNNPQTLKQPNNQNSKSPMEALEGMPNQNQEANEPVQVVEVEGAQATIVNNETITNVASKNASNEVVKENSTATANPEKANTNQNVVEESLEYLKEEYDDAKLNSVIIDQVKELIEIDNNLNTKIEDTRIDLKKEINEREQLSKKVDEHHKEMKELEKSIEKFIALYELITNQFNPFVQQNNQDTNQKMTQMMENINQKKQEQPLHPDLHFKSKSGKTVSNIKELISALKDMSPNEFAHHVTIVKNDFAIWVHDALKNTELAEKMVLIKEQKELIKLLEEN